MKGLDPAASEKVSDEKLRVRSSVSGIVFNIQDFAVDDGPGIRKLIFLKGCPLHCAWCSNPESQEFIPEVEFFPEKCIRCGRCLEVCPAGAVNIDLSVKNGFKIDRGLCNDCLQCAAQCPGGALREIGRVMTLSEVMREIVKDRSYYRKSGGGVTLSGGEPLAQPRFAREILRQCYKNNIHTAVETAGHVPWADLEAVLPYTDLIIFDVKHWKENAHRRMTGKPNRIILRNLRHLSKSGQEVLVRVPLIPSFNTDSETLTEIAKLLVDNNIKRVSFLPFHQFGKSKYYRLGREYAYKHHPNLFSIRQSPTLEEAKRIFAGYRLSIQE
jgi:pyruvate formate lyase activating enzyme